MLSILIPVYRWDVRPLVRALYAQARATGEAFELLVYDDASGDATAAQLRELGKPAEVRVKVMPENVGRARLRNRLATDARGDWLLFMDADAGVPPTDFLANYLSARNGADVLCGGTAYAPTPPADPAYYLRWHYGRRREQRSARVRAAAPYASFSTFNFMIRRTIFAQIRFDERLRTYGHEDTIFGWQLAQRKIPIAHLDNPLLHLGIDNNKVFMRKCQRSISNLKLLKQYYPTFDTRLLRAHRRLAWALPVFRSLEKTIHTHLLGPAPQLHLFDLWKLLQLNRQ